MCRAETHHLMCMLAAKGEPDNTALPSWFSVAHTAHTCPSRGLLSAKLLAFLCFLLVISWFKTASTLQCRAFQQISFTHARVTVPRPSSVLMNPRCIRSKLPLHTDTRDTGFCTDLLVNVMIRGSQAPNPVPRRPSSDSAFNHPALKATC